MFGTCQNVWIGQKIQVRNCQFYNRYIASHLLPHIGKHILDIGVGIGNVTEELIKQTETYTGIDFIPEHIKIACNRFRKYSFKGLAIDIERPGSLSILNSDAIDTIISINCFEHIEDDVSVMKMLFDWAKPGVKFVFWVPALRVLYGALDSHAAHFRRYNKTQLISKLQSAGFTVKGTRYINPIGALAWFAIGKFSAKQQRERINQQQLTIPWKIMYSLLPLARFPLNLQSKMESIFQFPVGLSLIAWGNKSPNVR